MQALAESSSETHEETGMFREVKIKTRCTHCKKGYRIDVRKVGQSQKCGNCGKNFIVQDVTS
jgi:transposase-like protein